MTEATHTAEAVYGLRKAVGKGARLWAGKIMVSQDDTLDTGLDTIEGISVSGAIEGTAPTSNFLLVEPNSVDDGEITWNARTADLSATDSTFTDATDTLCYVIATGTARGM